MFIGEYSHSLDEKGRVAVPKKFRTDLELGGVVTKGLDQCLWIYTYEEWKNIATKLSNLPISQTNTRAFARLMLAGAMDITIDKQGRVIIPEYLRQYAGLQKKVVVAGLYDRLEVWDETRWSEYKQKTELEADAIAEQLSELGI
jgi:MraZ protein